MCKDVLVTLIELSRWKIVLRKKVVNRSEVLYTGNFLKEITKIQLIVIAKIAKLVKRRGTILSLTLNSARKTVIQAKSLEPTRLGLI